MTADEMIATALLHAARGLLTGSDQPEEHYFDVLKPIDRAIERLNTRKYTED